jgi:hypothetical protein
LMVNPSGLLFHILCISMFSLGILSPSVMGRIISWSMDVFSRDCSTQRLKISGNSSCSSVQIARRNFSPLIQMNHHLTDVRWTNHPWWICLLVSTEYVEVTILSQLSPLRRYQSLVKVC